MESKKIKAISGTIGAIVIGLFTSFIYDWVKEKPIWSTLLYVGSTLWRSFIQFLNYAIPIWILLLSVFILTILLVSILYLKSISKPDYINYTTDRFKLWIWRWEWEWNKIEKKWFLTSLKPHCPRCDLELTHYRSPFGGQSYVCPRCEANYTDDSIEDIRGVQTIILDNTRKKKYNKSV